MKMRFSLLQFFSVLGIILTLNMFFFPHAAIAETGVRKVFDITTVKSREPGPLQQETHGRGRPLRIATYEHPAALLGRADARADTSKLLWFSMGCGSAVVSMYLVFPTLVGANSSGEFMGGVMGGLVGFVPWAMSYLGNAPPADRFVGKSPAYIEIYVGAYKEERHNIKKNWGIWGSILGLSAFTIAALSILASEE